MSNTFLNMYTTLDPEEINNQIEIKQILSPSNLFKNEKEVREFVNQGSVPELEAFLKECETEELYEYCVIIRDRINSLKPETNLIKEIYEL